MRSKIISTPNVKALLTAYEGVAARPIGAPGIVLVHGSSGFGKSTACIYLSVKRDAIFVTALPIWTPASMLAKLAEELSVKPVRGAAKMFDVLARELTMRPRPIFVDEADFVLESRALSETLRVLHDLTAVPMFLVGMGEARRKISARPQLGRRIMTEVEFRPLSRDDSALVAAELCEIGIGADLLDSIYARSKGSTGLLCAELARAESFARRRGLTRLSIGDLGEKERAAFAVTARIAA